MGGSVALGRPWSHRFLGCLYTMAAAFPLLKIRIQKCLHHCFLVPCGQVFRSKIMVLAGLVSPEALTCGLSSGCLSLLTQVALLLNQLLLLPISELLHIVSLGTSLIFYCDYISLDSWIICLSFWQSFEENQGLIMCSISHVSLKVLKTSEVTSTQLPLPPTSLMAICSAEHHGLHLPLLTASSPSCGNYTLSPH